jgi:hypothetical protein
LLLIKRAVKVGLNGKTASAECSRCIVPLDLHVVLQHLEYLIETSSLRHQHPCQAILRGPTALQARRYSGGPTASATSTSACTHTTQHYLPSHGLQRLLRVSSCCVRTTHCVCKLYVGVDNESTTADCCPGFCNGHIAISAPCLVRSTKGQA